MTYNTTRENKELLQRHHDAPASLSVQLHHDHWTLNSGSKFLYTSPAASFLDDIRAYRVPVDLLQLIDSAGIPFYEGCLVVELQDFREPPSAKDKKGDEVKVKTEGGPISSRVVLRPNSESSWADLRLLNEKLDTKWTDQEALEAEARILLATAPPLCLKPDPNLGRMANTMQRISTPRTPPPLRPQKRKLEATEADERAAARKVKIMQYLDPTRIRTNKPSQHFWDTVQRIRAAHPKVDPKNPQPAQHPQSEAGDEEEIDVPARMSSPPPQRGTATPAPNGVATGPHPTPVKSDVARSATGTPVPVPSAPPNTRVTPQVAAAAAAAAANRQITPRPGSTVPNPAAAYAAAQASQAAAAAQAAHAAGISRPGTQVPPPAPIAVPVNPKTLTPQQVALVQNIARAQLHNIFQQRRPQFQALVAKRSRGEALSPDEERLLPFALTAVKAEKFALDVKRSEPHAQAHAEMQKQYNNIIKPLVQQQVQALMSNSARLQQLFQQAQANGGQVPNQPQAPAPTPTPAPALPVPGPSATPVMAHPQIPQQPHAQPTPAQILQAQAAHMAAQQHAAAAQAQAQAQAHGHAPTQAHQTMTAAQQAMRYEYMRNMASQQQGQQHHLHSAQQSLAAQQLLAAQQHAASPAHHAGTPAQTHAQLPNGASPMFSAAQVNRQQLRPEQQQQMRMIFMEWMRNPEDPRVRAYLMQNPQMVPWLHFQREKFVAGQAAQGVGRGQQQAR